MDLLTHVAAGAAVAATLRARPDDKRQVPTTRQAHWVGQASFDGWVLLCAVAASLLPDADVFDNPFGEDVGGLSYMLFHRGVSHTIVGVLVLATAIAGLVTLLTRARAARFWRLWAAAALAAGLHLAMDATNDYGVHPFWPLDGRWIYGDFMFLSEPLLWAALLPMAMAPFLRDWGSRAVNLSLAAIATLMPLALIGFAWARVAGGEWMTPLPAVLVTLWVALQFLAYCRWFSRALGWVSVLAVGAVFFFAAGSAQTQALAWLEASAPGEELVQLVTTPAPANPFCFRVVSASRSAGAGEVTTRLGTLSLWPSVISSMDCYTPNRTQPPNARLASIADDAPGWHWVGAFHGSLAAFDRYASESCRVQLAKAFIRTPFWSEQGNGRVVIGDLRFDYAYDLDHYCKYRHQEGRSEPCPQRSVPWEAPFFGALALRDAAPRHARLAEKEKEEEVQP